MTGAERSRSFERFSSSHRGLSTHAGDELPRRHAGSALILGDRAAAYQSVARDFRLARPPLPRAAARGECEEIS
jgi:hypothetical protein